MRRLLCAFTGQCLGAASEEEEKAYLDGLAKGKPFIQRGYHGFQVSCKVERTHEVFRPRQIHPRFTILGDFLDSV